MPEAKKQRPFTTAQLTERYDAMQRQLDYLNGVAPAEAPVVSVCGKKGVVQLEDEDIPGLVARLDAFDSRLANQEDEYKALDERTHSLVIWLCGAWSIILLLTIAIFIEAVQTGVFAGWGW